MPSLSLDYDYLWVKKNTKRQFLLTCVLEKQSSNSLLIAVTMKLSQLFSDFYNLSLNVSLNLLSIYTDTCPLISQATVTRKLSNIYKTINTGSLFIPNIRFTSILSYKQILIALHCASIKCNCCLH